jgi:hypothetical protein
VKSRSSTSGAPPTVLVSWNCGSVLSALATPSVLRRASNGRRCRPPQAPTPSTAARLSITGDPQCAAPCASMERDREGRNAQGRASEQTPDSIGPSHRDLRVCRSQLSS